MEELEIKCIKCGTVDNAEGFWDYNEEDGIGVCHACGNKMIDVLSNGDDRNIT